MYLYIKKLTTNHTNHTNGRKEPQNKSSCLFMWFVANKTTRAPKTALKDGDPRPGAKPDP
jgi:hypothetical protein